MLTTTEAARALGLTRIAILKAISRGTLDAVKLGRDWLITPAAVEDYRQTRRDKPGRRPRP
jgi:excisionase family DNA binding protein